MEGGAGLGFNKGKGTVRCLSMRLYAPFRPHKHWTLGQVCVCVCLFVPCELCLVALWWPQSFPPNDSLIRKHVGLNGTRHYSAMFSIISVLRRNVL